MAVVPTAARRFHGLTVIVVVAVLALTVPTTARAAEDGEPEAAPLAVRSSVRAVGALAPDVQFHGSGWGHGVGLSQYGAYAMAQAGHSSTEILDHYYPGTSVVRDPRPESSRIRVNIQQNVGSTTVLPVEDEVAVRACGAVGTVVHTRVRHDDCVDWFTIPAGQTLQVCPFEGGVRFVRTEADGNTAGCDGPAVQTTGRPVARILHHGSVLRSPPAYDGGPTRRFLHGWRDIHSKPGSSADSPGVLDVVQDLPSVETYLLGLSEVPSSWGQLAQSALRAQAITGRTFALTRLRDREACSCTILSTPADQVYAGHEKVAGPWGTFWEEAVEATAGRVLTYQGELAQTFYSSSHGGRSENLEDSWAFGTTPVPYLRSVEDPWSLDPTAGNSRARWVANVENETLARFLSTGRDTPITVVQRLVVRSRTEGGTPRRIDVTGLTAAGDPVTFAFEGRPGDPKPIAGASFRRFLPVADGGTNGRLNSSQLRGFGFPPFTDDDAHIHEHAVVWAYEAGIVRGVDETRFAPNRPVTRGQMASYLVNTFEIDPADPRGRFDDVDPGDTHAANIAALASSGVASGYPDGSFRPDQRVTRAQMASFLAQALDLSTDRRGTFTDVDGGTHAGNIEALAESGITQGCDAGQFCPQDPVRRGQLAAFLQRMVVG